MATLPVPQRKINKEQHPQSSSPSRSSSSSVLVLVLLIVGGGPARGGLQRPLVDVSDGQDAGEEGVGQHGAHRRQRRQDLLAALVGHVVEVAPLGGGGRLAPRVLWGDRREAWSGGGGL